MNDRKIAYFSMEIGLNGEIPTYCGGLGVLAGDTLKSCADFAIPLVGVTLISREGFGENRKWTPEDHLENLETKTYVTIGNREVAVQAWGYEIEGLSGYRVPIIFLDCDLAENTREDREITDKLYGGDNRYRLKQEIVLGVGGVRALKALGYRVQKYHMNEGHSSLLALELLKERLASKSIQEAEREVKELCIFTTHTPIPAGHDKFPYPLVDELLDGYVDSGTVRKYGGKDHLNMTLLGFSLSEYINGVAKKHGETSQGMFPGYRVNSITNGVHPASWTCPAFQRLYDRHIKDWRHDPFLFRYVVGIPDEEIWQAHSEAKKETLSWINQETGSRLSEEKLTLGFARRMTEYKRPTLIFKDLERLEKINQTGEGLQLVFSGKAHPSDHTGKKLIDDIKGYAQDLKGKIEVAYLEGYDIGVAKKLVAGTDLWLNTPQKPKEASGTSGMKATLNGVLNFSVLDGWWIEGHIEDVTGWSIGEPDTEDERECIESLYSKLAKITETYYKDRAAWIAMMKNAISLNASFFNSHRMVHQYAVNAYLD